MNEEIFRGIGLSDAERRVYVALLDLGDSTRQHIVDKSGVAGSKVYELLEKLQQKGLVSIYIQDKVKHFKPTDPRQILGYLEDKKKEIELLETETKQMLPGLIARFSASKEEQEVELLTGIKGLEIIFREQVDLLKKGDTCYVIGGTRGSDEGAVLAFFEKIHIRREEKGIKTKMLFNLRQKNTTESLYGTKKFPETYIRYIGHSSPVAINVYKDRTVIIIFGKGITAMHIRSTDVAKSFIEYFELLWKQAK